MTNKRVDLIISNDLHSSRPDVLTTDCLRIECGSRVVIAPAVATRINLTVHNTSQVGRMAQIHSQFDNRILNIHIPNSLVYVGPESKTVVYAMIYTQATSGSTVVTFDVA